MFYNLKRVDTKVQLECGCVFTRVCVLWSDESSCLEAISVKPCVWQGRNTLLWTGCWVEIRRVVDRRPDVLDVDECGLCWCVWWFLGGSCGGRRKRGVGG